MGKKDIFKFIDHPKLIRPANYTKGVVGKGYNIYSCKDKKIAVINLIGRVDMNVLSENPFVIVKEIIENIQKEVDIIIIDFHAEATAEKNCFRILFRWKSNSSLRNTYSCSDSR